MKNIPIPCPHCGKDITEYVNRVTASRAARVSILTRPEGYYRELINKRWAKKKAADKVNKVDKKRAKDHGQP